MPILIPQTTRSSDTTETAAPPRLIQSVPIMATMPNTDVLANAFEKLNANDSNTQLPASSQQPGHDQQHFANITNSYSFSIELPETPTEFAADAANSHAPTEQKNYQSNVGAEAGSEEQHAMSAEQQKQQQLLQQQYQEYYQQYLRQQQQQHSNDASTAASNDADIKAAGSEVQSATVESCQAPVVSANSEQFNIPISHLVTPNQYPSLPNKIPNAAIVHSYSPIYVQAQAPQSGSDIYQEYVQNPYNLTLQQQEQHQHVQLQQQNIADQQNVAALEISNYSSSTTSSVNYFNMNMVDPSSIPPGSEMLYGQP